MPWEGLTKPYASHIHPMSDERKKQTDAPLTGRKTARKMKRLYSFGAFLGNVRPLLGNVHPFLGKKREPDRIYASFYSTINSTFGHAPNRYGTEPPTPVDT